MNRTDYLGAMATLGLGALLLALLLRPVVGERWFDIYGVATVALPTAVAAGLVLARRYRTLGVSPWRAVAVAAPVILLAAGQIGYWMTFFGLGRDGAVALAILRAVVLDVAGPWLSLAGLALVLILAWPLAAAGRAP